MKKTFTLESYWGKEQFIYIEDFPYTEVSPEYYGDDKILDMRDASKAQKFTKDMIDIGFDGQTFTYPDVIDWPKYK